MEALLRIERPRYAAIYYGLVRLVRIDGKLYWSSLSEDGVPNWTYLNLMPHSKYSPDPSNFPILKNTAYIDCAWLDGPIFPYEEHPL